MVGRGNAGWTTSKTGHPCPCQTYSLWLPAEKTGRGSLLNRPPCPPDDPIGLGTEMNSSRLSHSYSRLMLLLLSHSLLAVRLSLHPLSACFPACLSACRLVCLSVCVTIFSSVYLFVYFSILCLLVCFCFALFQFNLNPIYIENRSNNEHFHTHTVCFVDETRAENSTGYRAEKYRGKAINKD